MPVSALLAGRVVGRAETTVTVRRMLAFAAGLGALPPGFPDDVAEDFVALPALCVSFEWAAILDAAHRDTLALPANEARRAVHAVQDTRFHRPVRADDRLVSEARVVAVWSSRAGANLETTIETTDAQGRPVTSSRLVSVYRGVAIDGEAPARVERPAPPLPPPDAEHASMEIPLDAGIAHVYSECSGIWNPIHTERRAALAAGLPGPIVHGTALWALAAREILAREGRGEPGRLKRLHGRFAAMAVAGSTLRLATSSWSVPDGGRLVAFTLSTPEGAPAIADGLAELA